jgi:hypothetical protein
MGRKTKEQVKPQVNEALNGFDVKINEFGEIISSFDVGKLNEFLDETVEDKKFKGVTVLKREDDKDRIVPLRNAKAE